MHIEKIAGEQIPSEEHLMSGAVESAVPKRVSGQMDHPQPTPPRQFIAIRNRDIDFRRLSHSQQGASRTFQSATPTVDPTIGKRAINVCLFRGVGIEGRSAPGFGPSQVAGMIKVTVREQNRFHIARFQPQISDRPSDEPPLADEPRIEQDSATSIGLHQEVAYTHHTTNGFNPRFPRDFNHHPTTPTDTGPAVTPIRPDATHLDRGAVPSEWIVSHRRSE